MPVSAASATAVAAATATAPSARAIIHAGNAEPQELH